MRGAEQDEFHVLKERMEVKSAADKRASSRRTRKQGNRDIEEYDKMVVADQDEMERTYDNAYRGRVQNRKVETDLMSSYVLSFYSERTDVKRNPAYHRVLDAWNNANRSGSRLWLTIEDSSMDSLLIERHFRAIANASEVIEKQGSSTARRFARALDYYQVQDYESALADLNEVIS